MKYENKKNHHTANVSNCFTIMVVLIVIDYLIEESIEIIPHPPYSPDLAPCDFWLNDYIKINLADQELLFQAVCEIVNNIPEKWFKKPFDKLLERMELCINNNSD
jgi:histone-lysine N-methyltransferase SETMAR